MCGERIHDHSGPSVPSSCSAGKIVMVPTLETHPLIGWKTAGAEIEHAATRLVGHFWRSKDRERDGIQSRSGEGTTVTFFGDIPKEIREIFDRHKRRPM